MENFIGINIGSVSINVVSSDENHNIKTMKHNHQGNPQEVLQQIISREFNQSENYFEISGPFGSISEIKAIENEMELPNRGKDDVEEQNHRNADRWNVAFHGNHGTGPGCSGTDNGIRHAAEYGDGIRNGAGVILHEPRCTQTADHPQETGP